MTTSPEAVAPEPADPVQEQAAKIVQEIASIDDQVSKLTSRKDELKRTLAALLGVTNGAREISGAQVSVTAPKRFNPGKFAAEYPVQQYPLCYDSKPVAAKVKAVLGEDVYERFRVEADNKTVTIK